MADIHEVMRRLRELRHVAGVTTVYVVTEREPEYRGVSDDDESWTISTDPEEAGWCTDSGLSGYGLPKVRADYYAAAVNSLPLLLEYVEGLQKALERIIEGDSGYNLVDEVSLADIARTAIKGGVTPE